MKNQSFHIYSLMFFVLCIACSERKTVEISTNESASHEVANAKAEPPQAVAAPVEPIVKTEVKLPVPFDFGQWIGMTVTKEETLPKCESGWIHEKREQDSGSEKLVPSEKPVPPEVAKLEKLLPKSDHKWVCKGPVAGFELWDGGVELTTSSRGEIKTLVYSAENEKYDKKSIKDFEKETKLFHNKLNKITESNCNLLDYELPSSFPESDRKELKDSMRLWDCDSYSILDIYTGIDMMTISFSKAEINRAIFDIFMMAVRPPEWGQVIKLGNFSYTIESGELQKSIGRHIKYKASKGGTFVAVRYQIANDTNDTQTVMLGDLTLTDYKGRTFRTSSKGQTAISMQYGVSIGLDEIQPGLPQTQFAVFEVPEDSVASMQRLTLTIPEKGLLKAGTATFEFWFR